MNNDVLDLHRLATLGSLTGVLAHELGNASTSLLATFARIDDALTRARDTAEPATLDELASAVSLSRACCDRLLSLVRTIARSASLGCREAQLCHLRDLVDEALVLIGGELKRRARVTVCHEADLPAVRVVPGELIPAIVNVLLDTLHAIPAGHPQDHWIRIRLNRSGDGARIEVEGTGARGAADDNANAEPARQPDPLALTVSRAIVEAHGGQFEVNGDASSARAVVIYLPPG